MTKRGKFISFEGIDGAGKTSHIDSVAALIRARGISLISTREPGGTPLGEKLRALLLHESMHLETETLLMFAGRREHLAQVIEPALARGDFVLCDRFTDATYAYQGGGRGLAAEKLAALETWVHGHIAPDLTFLFDLPISVASERIGAEARSLDRFEQEKSDFHTRVRAAYLERAQADSRRIKVIDAAQTRAAIGQQIEAIILPYLVGAS